MPDDVENAAAFKAGAFFMIIKHHLDIDVEPGGGAEAHEVHMNGAIGDRVDL